MDDSAPTATLRKLRPWRPDLVYSALLLIAAVVAVGIAHNGLMSHGHGWGAIGFFLAFGLFTIAVGFPHPVFGHVSFDRVAQVASILVLGPVDAAWVNGLASLIYPWHRLRLGVPLPSVLTASLHNAGLMTLVILGSGLLYQAVGGPATLQALDLAAIARLLVLVVAMQVINDLGMMFVLYLRRADPLRVFNGFTTAVEFVSAAAGVVVGIALNDESTTFSALLLLVLVASMLVIMQYAGLRNRLEKLVAERTEELRVQAEEFERQATHDKLTGLPNRRHADSFLQHQIDLAQRNDRMGALALADIDHFKRINDRYSHAVGDRVLEQIARILREACRKTDFVARYGGEEFLLYFPDTRPERALQVCTHLRLAVQNADWTSVAPNVGVTISFGLAEIFGDSRCTSILAEADMRLYRAKREGRNRVIAA